MIPSAHITEWRAFAPWSRDTWIEQDLIISRALVEMFAVPELAADLAFRGGTALYKLYLNPAARYSEDIDLVQISQESIGDTLDIIRSVLDGWLGTPQRKLKEGRVNLVYRLESEESPPVKIRLKIEINSREHFTELGFARVPFSVESRWFSGAADITTFEIEELLGTKLRALYQRKKGRDLFDLWLALEQGSLDVDTLLRCFQRYMREGGHAVTRAQFEANLHRKAESREFRGDILPLLRPGVSWDFDEALKLVMSEVIAKLPGEPWKGSAE
jgi:predicted nucleotidyltransferase component of viral defense system